ncbi:MAG: TonB-dependent receptor [Pseudomonadota bacterium]
MATEIPRKLALASTVLALSATNAVALDDPNDLFDLSIEELVNLEVTSVNRNAERLFDTSSAVHVITRDDIERHGIRSIPEALRLAPGISALQIDANKWSIASRGFGGRFTNNLLVMMDCRLLYTPSFSGVYWDIQHTLIEEVERIEVIRGPGAVAWGTNAVNGVINIITANANNSGDDIVTGLDPHGSSFAGVRYSQQLSDSASYRAFVHYTDGASSTLEDGSDADDDWDLLRANVRADWSTDKANYSMTVDAHSGTMGSTQRFYLLTPPFLSFAPTETDVSGAYAMFDWALSEQADRSTSGQFYVDYSERSNEFLYGEDRLTISAEIQHRRTVGRHEISVGGSLRNSEFDFRESQQLVFSEDFSTNRVASAYIQDEYWLSPDRLSVTAGLKLENNNYSPDNIEWMPSLRILWKPSSQHTVWGAVTRAVRSPAISDLGLRIVDLGAPLPPLTAINPFPLPARQGTVGNPDFESETSVSIEFGVRGQLSDRVSYDFALFSTDYDGLRSLTLIDPLCSPSGINVVQDPSCLFTSTEILGLAIFTNDDDGFSNGGELAVDWQVRDDLRLRTSVSVANDKQQSSNSLSVPQSSAYPPLQASVRALWSPQDKLSVAVWVRYVDDVEANSIDNYWQANLHARWNVNNRWIASFGIRNAIEDDNIEARSQINELPRIYIETAAFANLRYSF